MSTDSQYPARGTENEIGTLALSLDMNVAVAGMKCSPSQTVKVSIGSENFAAECFYQLARLLEAGFAVERTKLVESLCAGADAFDERHVIADTLFQAADSECSAASFALSVTVEFFSSNSADCPPDTFTMCCNRQGVRERFFQLARLLERELPGESTALIASLRYVAKVLQEQNGELAPRLPQPEAAQEEKTGSERTGLTLSLYRTDHDRIKAIRYLIEDRNGGRRVSESEAVRVALRFVSLENGDALFNAYRAMQTNDGRRKTTVGRR